MNHLCLVDFSAYLHAAFSRRHKYSVGSSFDMMCREIRSNFTHVVFALDNRVDGLHRRSVYEGYKANRQKKKPKEQKEFDACSVEAQDAVAANMMPMVRDRSGKWEADDVMATLAKRADERGFLVTIKSRDKDLKQCITERVVMHHHKTGYTRLEDLPYPPKKMIDLQALTGDQSDNVPGCPGIGPVQANRLLEQFEGIDEIYAGLDQIDDKRTRTLLENGADSVLMSNDLVLMRSDVNLDHFDPRLSVIG